MYRYGNATSGGSPKSEDVHGNLWSVWTTPNDISTGTPGRFGSILGSNVRKGSTTIIITNSDEQDAAPRDMINELVTVGTKPPSLVENYPGLAARRYSGYFGVSGIAMYNNTRDNVNYTDNLTPVEGPIYLTEFNNFFAGEGGIYNNTTWSIFGYFLAPTTGTYTFYTASDDGSYLWIGDDALSGYTTQNALVNNGGVHSFIESSGSINLVAGTYYPIRIIYGNQNLQTANSTKLTISFSGPGIAKRTDGNGYFFNYSTQFNIDDIKYLGIGLNVTGNGVEPGTTISSYDKTTGIVILNPPNGSTYSINESFTMRGITFSKNIGENTLVNYRTYKLNEYEKYRIRFRYFIPREIDAELISRYINFDLIPPNSNEIELRFTYLYSLDYDFSEPKKGYFSEFLEKSINYGGGVIGGVNDPDEYVFVKTSKKIDITYQPKTSESQIIKSTTNASVVSQKNIMSIPNTSNIEVGNYVFGPGLEEGTRVDDITINNFIILSKNSIATTDGTYTFIEHRGFVKRAVGSSSGTTFTISSGNTSSLKTGMIMIGSNIQAYTGITTSSSTTNITISPSQIVNSGTTVYFYESKGLINNSLSEFCIPTETKCLIVTADTPAGSTTIPVNDSTGVSNGWNVQGVQFDSGTTVQGSPPNTTTIAINKPTIRNLVAGSNFTVTSNSSNKTLCCPPIDTSPPFNPTLEGLETVSDAPNLRLESGNIIFDSLRANVTETNITSYSPSNVSRSRIPIQTPIGTFKILCA